MRERRKQVISIFLCVILLFVGNIAGYAAAEEETADHTPGSQSYEYSLNDPMSGYQYYVNSAAAENTEGPDVSTWGYPEENCISTNAGQAWDQISGDEDEVVVAIIDSGININHEDLKDVLWTNPGDIGLPGDHGFNFSNNREDLNDLLGHGTHCAGIIAAMSDNNTGIAGVASGANVKIMMLGTDSAVNGEEEDTNDAYRELAALNYVLKAKQSGVNIVAVSNSWGNTGSSEDYDSIINQLGEEGVLCFIAAGNHSENLDYVPDSPAGSSSPYRVTVGAVNESGNIAGFSNYGRSIVDLFAPGVDILSTVSYPSYFPNIYSEEERNDTTAYYGLFDENTVITDEYVIPSVTNCDETVKAFGASVFHIQKGFLSEEENDADPAYCEFTLVDDHYFTNSENPVSLKVTIHNAVPGEEYYLYFPYEKDPETTGSDNTDFSITAIREHEEGTPNATLTLGEVVTDEEGNCSITGGGFSEGALNDKYKGIAVHACSGIFQNNCLISAEELGNRTAGIGLCVILGTGPDAQPGDVSFYLDSIAVSRPGADISADEAYDIISGTSMACPCAAGAYAVLASLYPRQEGQSGAEYAIEMKARLLSCVRTTDELWDKCKSGGYLDLSLIGNDGPVLMRAECDLEQESLTLYGDNLNADYTLSYQHLAGEDQQLTELPSGDMTVEYAPDGKRIVIRNAKTLFSTYTQFTLSDDSGIRTKLCDFLVKGQNRPEKVYEEPYREILKDKSFVLERRALLTDAEGEKLYGYEPYTGVLSVYDGTQFYDIRDTDLKDSVLSYLSELGYNEYELTHNVYVDLQNLTDPVYTDDLLFHPLTVTIMPYEDADYEDYTIFQLQAFLNYTDPDPEWTFIESSEPSELFGMYGCSNITYVGMDGKIYCLGQETFEDFDRPYEPFMYSYDIAKGTWTKEQGLPVLKNEMQLMAKDGVLYAACGYDLIPGEYYYEQVPSYEIYCYEDGTWKLLGDIPYIGNDPDSTDPEYLSKAKGAIAAVKEGLLFINCPAEGGGNVFLFNKDTGVCEPLYYTFTGFKPDNLQVLSAVETKNGIYYFEESGDGYLTAFNLYLLPADLVHTETENTLPAAFDLRNVDGVSYVTPVKFQNPYGNCWIFAAVAAAETSILGDEELQGDYAADLRGEEDGSGKIQMDLSEKHLAYFARTPLNDPDDPQNGEGTPPFVDPEDPNPVAAVYNMGGKPPAATSLFAAGIGPVLESENSLFEYKGANGTVEKQWVDGKYQDFCYSQNDDWTLDESLRFSQSFVLKESFVLPSPANVTYDVFDNIYTYNEEGTIAIKEQLLQKRGVQIAYKLDDFNPVLETHGTYMSGNWAQYTFVSESADHAVCIIGWDDNYPAENFRHASDDPEEYTEDDTVPPGDGAWLVKNSWGSGTEDFPNKSEGLWGIPEQKLDENGNPVYDENGDPVMTGSGYFWLSYYDKSISSPEALDFENNVNETDVIDQHDFMPVDEYRAVLASNEISIANVFEAKSCEELMAVSCETTYPKAEVTIDIYLLADGYTDPADGLLMERITAGPFKYGGYHRIDLNNPFTIMKGQAYSVVVTQKVPDESGGSSYVFNYQLGTGGNGIIGEGESFVLADGSWHDFSDPEYRAALFDNIEGVGFDDTGFDNFAIKGYARSKPDIILETGYSGFLATIDTWSGEKPKTYFMAWLTDNTGLDYDVIPEWSVTPGGEDVIEIADGRDPSRKIIVCNKLGYTYLTITAEGIGTVVYPIRVHLNSPSVAETEAGDDSIVIRTDDNIEEGISGIEVSYRIKDTSEWTILEISPASNTIELTGLQKGTNYEVKLRSWVDTGEGIYFRRYYSYEQELACGTKGADEAS